jgi:FixJ family two-component response regulator
MNPHPPVFVVEDEDAVRSSLERLLRAIGVPARTFASAESFLESYAGEQPACLLVDIRMPGMSGLDLIEELARRRLSLPTIVMTGHTDMKSLHRLNELETIGFLEKPFSIAQLKEVLARWRSTLGEDTPSA